MRHDLASIYRRTFSLPRNCMERVYRKLTTAPPIYVYAPGFYARSGGIRAMHLLCHHLNRLGYEAYLEEFMESRGESYLDTPHLTDLIQAKHRSENRMPIAIYPEVTKGNPLQAPFVVRYLLNRPGYFTPGVEQTFEPDDYFFHYAAEHVPTGTRSSDLFMPLVDRRIYRPPPAGQTRDGFVIYSHRVSPDPAAFPDWLKPVTTISMQKPLSAPDLAELYRHSRAMVTQQRGTAILEALHCGCPVICIPHENFSSNPLDVHFSGLGLIWGWHEERLARASAGAVEFRRLYRHLEATLDDRLRKAMNQVIRDIKRRRGRIGPS